MTANGGFAEPWDPTSQDDLNSCDISIQYGEGWFYDPIFFGKYPDGMVNTITDGRLPTFTEE